MNSAALMLATAPQRHIGAKQQPVTISQQPIDTIAAVLHQNNRLPQPLNPSLILK
ncbi:MAG TPA: hypothetical protein VIS52_07355 [Motiliproteus sp.]